MTENRAKFISVRHILVRHSYEAEDLLLKINKGEDFAQLASKWSLCASRSQGGDLGRVALHRLSDEFADAARKLEIGEISKPVRTPHGHHLILRYG
jgi:parvulin-like peptidyl-prolyl isomerase